MAARVLLALLWLGGAAQAENAYVIRDARIVTVSGPVIERGSVLVADGLIRDVGATVAAPPGAVIIDARGQTVYPGLFDANSLIGMEAARENTMGELTPHLRAWSSFHMEDELLETARANGVTEVLCRPGRAGAGGRLRRGLLPGQAAVMSLGGWTQDQMAIDRAAAVVLNYPSVGNLQYTDDERFAVVPFSTTRKQMDESLAELKRFFAEARAYMNGHSVPDLRLDAMIPVLKGEKPVLIDVDNEVDITNAVEFAKAERLSFILSGAAEAWKVADYLKANGARVILSGTYTTPAGEDDPVDALHRSPALLHQKGIPFAMSVMGSAGYDSRHLRYQAGTAVAYGLPYEAALRSVTLAPAELLGVADKLGSIDKGKKANLVVADGDILECRTKIVHVFVNGRPISLETRDTRLWETYRERP
jgi:imidazolonepropionase-like amidohydrolase